MALLKNILKIYLINDIYVNKILCQFFFTCIIKSAVNYVKVLTALLYFYLHITIVARRAERLLNTYAKRLHGVFRLDQSKGQFAFH